MIILSAAQIILMHSMLLAETGGLNGIRDRGLLDSAVNAPFQTFGEELYKSTEAKKNTYKPKMSV